MALLNHSQEATASWREEALKSKAEYRNYLAHAPIPEKLRILEEMRDFTLALREVREENKMQMKAVWDPSPALAGQGGAQAQIRAC